MTDINTALRSLLNAGGVRNTKPHVDRSKKFSLPSILTLGEDGVDHINCDKSAKTDLGLILAITTDLDWRHEYLGNFLSIQRFWYFVTSPSLNDKFRSIRWQELRRLQAEEGTETMPNFRALMVDAMAQRIRQYPDIVEAMKNSTLPFDCYAEPRENSDKEPTTRKRQAYADWIVEALTEIRAALKEDREVNIDKFRVVRQGDLYEDLKKRIETLKAVA